MRLALHVLLLGALVSCACVQPVSSLGTDSTAPKLAPCEGSGTPGSPPPSSDATTSHVKTSATVVTVTSPCTVQIRIPPVNSGYAATFNDRTITLRTGPWTTFATPSAVGARSVAVLGLTAGDTFTLAFDGRANADGSYSATYINR